jgi:hypothetical protein
VGGIKFRYCLNVGDKQELIWHITGTLVGSTCEIGRRSRKFWKLVIEVEHGYLTVYVRAEELLEVAASLEPGDAIEASGVLKPHKEVGSASRPIFIDNPSTLRKDSSRS